MNQQSREEPIAVQATISHENNWLPYTWLSNKAPKGFEKFFKNRDKRQKEESAASEKSDDKDAKKNEEQPAEEAQE